VFKIGIGTPVDTHGGAATLKAAPKTAPRLQIHAGNHDVRGLIPNKLSAVPAIDLAQTVIRLRTDTFQISHAYTFADAQTGHSPMGHSHDKNVYQQHLLRRFWRSASGFWTGQAAWRVWVLCASLFGIVVAQLLTQYWLNFWNRDFFNALEAKDSATLARTILLFFPLAALSTALAIVSVWGRMTTQRLWRKFLTTHLINIWLTKSHYRSLGHLYGTANPQNSEYRIAEDARVATDAPIDLVLALFSSILTAGVFLGLLASIGGSVTFEVAGMAVTIPGYLAFSVVAYSSIVTAAILLIGRQYTNVVQNQVQAEAAFRAAANLIRESGEGLIVTENEAVEVRTLWNNLHTVIQQWRILCWQYMRTTFVTHGNGLLVPIVALILCVPKYLSGSMSLGEVTQAAAAFATVQAAFNWLVDNFQRMADWRAAANRVAILLLALDDLQGGGSGRVQHDAERAIVLRIPEKIG
jgi:vitamin B12/bleomycin/antimicrobial peptide transport system ATP-binding/permease protein